MTTEKTNMEHLSYYFFERERENLNSIKQYFSKTCWLLALLDKADLPILWDKVLQSISHLVFQEPGSGLKSHLFLNISYIVHP